MAANKRVMTLGLNFDVDKQNLEQISRKINEASNVKLTTKRSDTFLKNAIGDLDEYLKKYRSLVKEMQKPMHSKSQARELGYSMNALNTDIKQRIGGLKGSASRIYNTPKNSQNILDVRKMGTQIDAIQDLINKIKELRKERAKLGTNKSLDTQRVQAKTELKGLDRKESLTPNELNRQKELNNILGDINKKLREKEAIQTRINALLQASGYSSVGEAEGARDELIRQQGDIQGQIISPTDSATLEKSLNGILDLLKQISAQSHTVDEMGDSFDDAREAIRKAEQQEKTFNDVLSQLGIPLLTLNEVARGIRQVIDYSFEYIKNLDKALTEIAVVSDKTRDEALALTDTFIDLASKTGMAIDDIAQASTIFYQQGLADDAVRQLTEYTAIFAKISGEDVPTAADQLTAAINGFGWSADRVGDVVDKLSVLAAYSAADTQELATAMSKAASQASMAGLSFDQYNAYLATMIETTREAPENIGTSLKTIMSRFLSIKSGENTEDDTDINAVETALKSVGVQLRDSQGQLRELGDVLDELGPKWDGLDRNTQAYLGTVIAGTRQQSRFISLMQHWDRALELTAASENSAGAAAEMHAKAMEGLDAVINNLTIAWQDFISNIANGDTFKSILKLFTGLIKWLGNGNSIMKAILLIVGLLDAKALLVNSKIIQQNKMLGDNKLQLQNVDATWGLIRDKVKDTVSSIKEAVSSTEELTIATNNLNAAQGNKTPEDTTPVPEGGKTSSGKLSGKLGNIVGMIGKIQSAITIASTVIVLAQSIGSFLGNWGNITEKDLQKVEDSLEKRQKEIDKTDAIIKASTETINVYNKLNKKISLTTDELDELSAAAKEVAAAIPEAVMGYDANGNPIINQAVAKSVGKNAENRKSELARDQIGDLIYKDIAESVLEASQDYQSSTKHKALGAGKVVSGIGAAVGATVGLLSSGPIGWVILAISAVGLAATEWADTAAENAEKIKAAQKEIKQAFSDENLNEIQKQMTQISKAAVGTGSVDGTSEESRAKASGSIASSWLSTRATNIKQQFYNDEISKKEMEEQVKDLGYEWEKLIYNTLGGTKGLAKISKQLESMARNVEDKTYESLEQGFEQFMSTNYGDIDKNSEVYKSLKQAFFNSALEGTSGGLLSAINQLEGKIGTLSGNEKTKYEKILAQVKGMTTKEADMYGASGIFNNADVFNKVYSDNGDMLRKQIATNASAPNLSYISALTQAKNDFYNEAQAIVDKAGVKDANHLSNENKEKYNQLIQNAEDAKDAIEEIWNSMSYSAEPPWEQLWTDLEKINKQVDSTKKTLAELLSGDGIDYSSFKDWTTTVLDSFNYSSMTTDQLNRLSGIMDTLTNSMEVQNGRLVMNQEAMSSMVDLQRELVQAEVQEQRMTLQTSLMELEAERDLLLAQKATLEYKLGMGTTEEEANQKWTTAKVKMQSIYDEAVATSAANMVNVFAQAYSTNLENYNKMLTAQQKGESVSDFKIWSEGWSETLENFKNMDYYLNELKKNDLTSREDLLGQLDAVNNALGKNAAGIENIEMKLKILDFSDTFSEGAASVADAAKELEKYQGELEEIYNTLRKIEGIQNRMDNLDKLIDMSLATKYTDYMYERVALAQKLADENKTLVAQQKYLAQHERDLIKNSEVGDVFDFDQIGAIMINWEKYNALQDESIDGEMTLKELADKLYDEYKDVYDSLLDYNSDWVDSNQQVIDSQQEMLDVYIDLENKLAEAVKDIYQDMLDTKLEAIDTEIEALDKLKDARDKANKDRDNSRELSQLQTSLKRAMMDTSGASNTKVLSYQDQIRSKLEEMGEDEYTERLDAIKDALNEQKDFLQREFDEFFEDWQKLHEMVDKRILENQEAVKEVMRTTQDFKQANEIQRAQQMEEIEKQYDLIDTMRTDTDGGIRGIFDNIVNTKKRIDEVSNWLETSMPQEVGTQLSRVIKDYTLSQLNALEGRINNTINSMNNNNNPPANTKLDDANPPAKEGTKVEEEVLPGLADVGKKYIVGDINAKTYEEKRGQLTEFRGYTNRGSQLPKTVTIKDKKKFNGREYVKVRNTAGKDVWMLPSNLVGCAFKNGGLADFTGPAWLDGTRSNPEAVLDAAQTKAFMSFTDKLTKLDATYGLGGSTVNIENISFEVDSMSSPEDGEAAFDAFVQRFKEVGKQSGLSFVKNRL